MKELGINSGDVVRVSGVRSTGAICMPLENGYNQPNDSKITYLPESSELRQVRISNIVALNTNNEGASMVEIGKVQSSIAQKVTFTTFDTNCNQLDRKKLEGLVVCKRDRITFDYRESGPCCMFWVTDVHPDDFSIIDKTTEIELVTRIPIREELKSLNFFPDLTQLKRVIAISKQVNTGTVNIIVPSIELYDDGAKFYVYLKGTYGTHRQKFVRSHISLTIRVEDDIGNLYNTFSAGGGGSSAPDGFSYDWSCMFGPQIHASAKELTIILKEILIQESFLPPFQSGESESSLMFSPVNKFPDMLVLSGPWEFKVALLQQ